MSKLKSAIRPTNPIMDLGTYNDKKKKKKCTVSIIAKQNNNQMAFRIPAHFEGLRNPEI